MQKITVSANEAGQRLDKLLGKYLSNAPMSFVYKMLRKKNIKLNGKKAQGNEKLTKETRLKYFSQMIPGRNSQGHREQKSSFRQILHGQWKAASGCR